MMFENEISYALDQIRQMSADIEIINSENYVKALRRAALKILSEIEDRPTHATIDIDVLLDETNAILKAKGLPYPKSHHRFNSSSI